MNINKSVTSIISIFLDVFRPELAAFHKERYRHKYSAEWTRKRIEFFRKWTLKSLRNQSFQDFRIFMLCSKKSKPLIDSYIWDDNIEHCYDYGKINYEAIDTDYVAITRLDTDDLFRWDAMEIIRNNLTLSNRVERLFSIDYYRWLFHHNCFICVTNPLKIEKWSPCYTFVFPKSEYKNWSNIKKRWFVYAPEICAIPGVKTLPPGLVCMIRIKESIHHALWKQNSLHRKCLEREIKSAKRFRRKIIFSPDEQIKILKNFGISEKEYRERK